MKIKRELTGFSLVKDAVITLGVFDGVHIGHRHVIQTTVTEARKSGRLAIVTTLRNHPRSVLELGFRPRYITGLDERISLMQELGVDHVIPVTFDLELSKLSSQEFIQLLQHNLRLKTLVVGPDFALGYRRKGDINELRQLSAEMDFSLFVVDLLGQPDCQIRSTSVRKAIQRGDVTLAAELLGRYFSLDGIVETGVGRGKTLGFPTANLNVSDDRILPSDGIYATWAYIGSHRYMAATCVGTRPTFEETARTIESYLLDFKNNLYGSKIRVEFVKRLRDDIQYDSAETLKTQMDKDVTATRDMLRRESII